MISKLFIFWNVLEGNHRQSECMDTAENPDFSRDLGELHRPKVEAIFYLLEKSQSVEIETIYDIAIESQKKENMA